MAIDRRLTRQGATLRSVYAVRGFLILALFAFQSLEVSESYGWIASTALWVVPAWCIAALFALAGFTAMRSVEQRGARSVAARSALRFLPALALVLVVTAYGIGAAVTTESRRGYFIEGEVASYLLNLIGLVRYTLPGVFEFNAAAGAVNPTLWLVPVGYLAALTLAGAAWRPRGTTYLLVTTGLLLVIISVALSLADVEMGSGDALLALLLSGKGLCALLSFIVGTLIYRLRRHVFIDWRVAVVFAVPTLAVAAVTGPSWSDAALFNGGIAVPISYLAIYACSWPWPLRRWAPRAAPLLWRILLLSYPVQQLWIAVGPDRQSPVVNLALAFPVVVVLACGEWFLLERPLLQRFCPGAVPATLDAPSGRLLDPRGFVQQARETAPLLLGAVFVIVLMLAALALTMFAMQRDAGGA